MTIYLKSRIGEFEMMDLRSAGQLVGLLLAVRLSAYGLIRLIETFKPRPVHFIVTATLDRKPQVIIREEEKSETTVGQGTPDWQNRHYPQFGKRIWRMVRCNLSCYWCYLSRVKLLRRRKTPVGPQLKLITEVIGLLTAGISLVVLVLERFCNR